MSYTQTLRRPLNNDEAQSAPIWFYQQAIQPNPLFSAPLVRVLPFFTGVSTPPIITVGAAPCCNDPTGLLPPPCLWGSFVRAPKRKRVIYSTIGWQKSAPFHSGFNVQTLVPFFLSCAPRQVSARLART